MASTDPLPTQLPPGVRLVPGLPVDVYPIGPGR